MKQKQKIFIFKIISVISVFSAFFVFLVPLSLASINIPPVLFEFSESSNNSVIGEVDISAENKIKVCKDVTCTNPAPGIIDFEMQGDPSFSINEENNLIGKIWGNELGWITFNPPYGGVSIADRTTGLLKGTAWSENSGAINFSVTGQKVVIDPTTGEWNGWAWAAGPYGGWIKFDCAEKSCVRIIWRNSVDSGVQHPTEPIEPAETEEIKEAKKIISPSFSRSNLWRPIMNFVSFLSQSSKTVFAVIGNFADSFAKLFSNTRDTINQKSRILGESLNAFSFATTDLFNKTARVVVIVKHSMFDIVGKIGDAHNSLVLHSKNARDSVFKNAGDLIFSEIGKINGSAFVITYKNLKQISSESFFALQNFSDKMVLAKNKLFDTLGDKYYDFSFNLINLKTSFLTQIISFSN